MCNILFTNGKGGVNEIERECKYKRESGAKVREY